MIVRPNGDGTVSESPSIRLVTTEMLSHWSERAKQVQNPILAARYAGLVWDFTKKVNNIKPSIDIAKLYLNAINRIANENYFKVELYVYTKLKRALSIAILLQDKALIEQCKNSIITFEANNSADNLPGIWGHAFDLLIFNKKVSLTDAEEQAIISELEAKLERLLSVEPEDLVHHIWAAQHAATRLGDYYRKKSDKVNVERVICRFASSSEFANKEGDVAQVAANAEELYKLYQRYNLKEQAATMLLKVREHSAKVPAEMKRIGADINIPNDKIKEYLDGMTADNLESSLYRLMITYIPIVETATERLTEKSNKAPISYLFTHQIVDNKGRVITTIPPLAEDFESHLVRHIYTDMTIQSIMLKILIDKLIDKYGFNSTDILFILKDCPVLNEERKKIIERGLEAYFLGDFLVAVHLIVPQIEEAIRNIVEFAGGNVLKESRSGGFHVRTFDDILRDPIIAEALDPDLVNYYKILFTDQRGWNLRNNVCHGMTDFKEFDYKTADRLIHALICLSLIKEIEE